MITVKIIKNRMIPRIIIKSVTYFKDSLRDIFCLSLKIGTKAEARAPSAKNALNKLGIANATKKASVTNDAP